MPWVVSQFINPCCSVEERQSKHQFSTGESLIIVLGVDVVKQWHSADSFKACVADTKCRVNIPGGLYEPLPSASPIASVNHNRPQDWPCAAQPHWLLLWVYFILCRKETESVPAACSAEQGKEFGGDQDSPLLLAEEEMDFSQEGEVTEQGRMDSKWQ